MSSLSTKYRPTTFDEIVGQDNIIESLKKVVKEGRQHTFLFAGPSGVGKTTVARILANEFAGGKANQRNIVEIDAASHTGVDDMRSIAASAHHKAIGKSTVKTLIIDEAHRLSGNAWDSLLKITEEPPAHTYWILCTTNLAKIPKTIQTRFLSYYFREVSEKDLLSLLDYAAGEESFDIDEEVLDVIAENAGGSPRQALNYLEVCQYCESASEARKALLAAGETKEIIDLCRFLINPRGKSWQNATKLLKSMDSVEAESIRIVVCNYFAKALLDAKSDKEAQRLLAILENFSEPYNSSEKMAPLLLSIAGALGMDE